LEIQLNGVLIPSQIYSFYRSISYAYELMELADLETFLAVVRERSFSRAAEKLGRTQPAVSLAIQRLESSFGERLFDRSNREGMLTDAGRLVLEHANHMVNERERLALALVELRDRHRGRVTVGANESTALYLLPVIERFRARYPLIKVEVRRSLSRAIPGEVLAGNLDLGVISYDPGQHDLSSTVVYRDRLAFVVYPGHRLAGKSAIDLRELGSESFIVHNVESPYRALTIRAFQKHRVQLNIDLEMPTVESIKRLVMQELGVAFVPRVSAEREIQEGSLVEVPIRQFRIERPLRLVYRRRGSLSYAAQSFFEVATGKKGREDSPTREA
jgi:DNA-binding transcriptional LysR family regulator